MSYKIRNKHGKCIRRGSCYECPGFKECDKEFKAMLKRIDEIRAKGFGYYSWEDNYQGPYENGRKYQTTLGEYIGSNRLL